MIDPCIFIKSIGIIIQKIPMNIFEIITTSATLVALATAIYQSILARRSLDEAKKAIDEDKRSRQLSMIPKMYWVIAVQMRIDRWLKDLKEIKVKTLEATKKRDGDMLRAITITVPRHPKDIVMKIDSLDYEKMPDSLREIMISGAQYFYDAISPVFYLWTEEKGPLWDYASSIQERLDDSISALEKLKHLIIELVPGVILETPASINERDFLKK